MLALSKSSFDCEIRKRELFERERLCERPNLAKPELSKATWRHYFASFSNIIYDPKTQLQPRHSVSHLTPVTVINKTGTEERRVGWIVDIHTRRRLSQNFESPFQSLLSTCSSLSLCCGGFLTWKSSADLFTSGPPVHRSNSKLKKCATR